MVKPLRTLCMLTFFTAALGAELTVSDATFDTSAANIQKAISLLDRGLGTIFYGLASVAGQPIVNSAAFSSTIGIQRQEAWLPRFQLEPAAAWIQPDKVTSGQRLNSSILYSANIVGGFKLNDNFALQVRAFYLPEIAFNQSGDSFSLQPFSLGVSLTKQVKKNGDAWYSPAITTPLDIGYMHGTLTASFRDIVRNIEFVPDGGASAGATARGDFRFHDEFKLRWDVVSLTTGLIVSKPLLWIFTGRMGILTSIHTGIASLSNTVTGDFIVTSSTTTATDTIRTNDTATLVLKDSATFKPILVSNQITAGLGLRLGPVTLNLDISRNLQINATAFMVQAGCFF
ncbi:MAG: hypothetical protein KF713_16405 [Turneriella sp.]|nr:hypothetical protein [Turneriella sp.]